MRSIPRKTAVAACVLLILPGLFVIMSTAPALAPPIPFDWQSTGGGAGFVEVTAFAYDPAHDVLYAGTNGLGVKRCDDPGSAAAVWSDTNIDPSAYVINSLAYDSGHDILYAGTAGGLRRCENPTSYTPTWTEPPSAVTGCRIDAIAYDSVHDFLYAGWYDGGSMRFMGLWRCNNPRDSLPTWNDISAGADVGSYRIDSLVYDGSRNLLYAGCSLATVMPITEDGKGVWRCSDPDSSPSWLDTGTGTIDSSIVEALAYDPLGDFLYAGTDGDGAWRCDTPDATPTWTDIGGGFGTAKIEALVYDPNNNALYAGVLDSSGVRQCLTPDTSPDWSATGGAIGAFDVYALALDPYRFVLFADTYDSLIPAKQDVFWASVEPGSRWYFAEGWTGPGFQEYLCLGNPGAAEISARVAYLFPDGISQTDYYTVPPYSRVTVDVNASVGPDRNVSMYITSSAAGLIAERPMYFDYTGAGGHWTGGHDAVGALSAEMRWYFAEGYTGPGFDEWICVLNPGDSAADLTFRFQTQEEGEKTVTGLSVPAHSRSSFKANDLLGGGYFQTSLALESTQPVVAERPMYFSYSGTGGWNWTGGHCVMGVPVLATEYFFAEGTTRPGFEEWLTLQNPGTAPIDIQATYMLGTGAIVDEEYTVGAAKRSTVYVPGEVGSGEDVSVYLTCSSPFLAERPMYFYYQGLEAWGWTGGHCVIGATADSTEWFFAEGYTGTNFEQWICIQNPGATDATVAVTYYPEGGATPTTRGHKVAANSRYTIPVNVDAGPDLSISTGLSSDQPIICERPMYFSYNGIWPGGHDVVGYAP